MAQKDKKKKKKSQFLFGKHVQRDSVSANSQKLKNRDPIPSQAAILDRSQLSKQINFNVCRSYLKGETDRTLMGRYLNFIIIELIWILP